MERPAPNPLQRLGFALYALFAVLFRTEVAVAVRALWERRRERTGGQAPAGPSPEPSPAATARSEGEPLPVMKAEELSRRAALQLLGLLQREGRLVDFVQEDLTAFPDAAVGAAARAVHAGCKRALAELFRLEPVLREPEGTVIEVTNGFDPAAIRLTGSVVGNPPFRGALRHHGWRAEEVRLPAQSGTNPAIVAPAEVEL